MADVEHLQRRAVELLNLQILVDDNDAAGHVIEYLIAEALGFVHDKGQTHAVVCFAAVDGDCLVAAGVVAAGAAVELVALCIFAEL